MWNMLLAFKNLDPMNWDVIKPALKFLWQGLLAIFVVIFLIIVAVKLTSYTIAKCEEYKKNKAQEQENDNENSNE